MMLTKQKKINQKLLKINDLWAFSGPKGVKNRYFRANVTTYPDMNNGQKSRSQCVRYSEVPLYIYTHQHSYSPLIAIYSLDTYNKE